MANIPDLRSREQIFGDLVDAFLARTKEINDLNRGSVIKQFFDAVAQGQFKAAADIIAMIDALSIDRATGDALQRLARDRNVPIKSGTPSSGPVTITDLTFSKVETTVFAGQAAPVAGSSKIYVTDASKYSSTGSLYIGRGTPNVEGPLKYISKQPEGGGAYWSISLDPTSLTTKFHNIGETVVMAQGGNRLIAAGTSVTTAQGNADLISFTTVSPATILDGETVVENVPVVCADIGKKGNVPRGAIREATALPFTASVYNPNPFSNGTPPDDDDALRARIKAYEQAKSKGTEIAIQLASIDVLAEDELKKVQSSAVVRYADRSAALVFDDGSGYEPLYSGVGLEQVVDEALGGERELQLRQRPITQVRIKNNVDGPYNIQDAYAIDVEVQGVRLTHYFKAADFKVLGSGTPHEVVNSINGDPNFHCYATTADGGTRLVLFPRDRSKNDMQVKTRTTFDANSALGFPLVKDFTIRLYKDDSPLYQDGLIASLQTRIQPLWSTNIGGSETLKYQVDNCPEITATMTDTDFQNIDPTETIRASTPLAIWAEVFNGKLPGLTAVVNGEMLIFTSNLGYNNRSAIKITGGSLMDKIFVAGGVRIAAGRASDYTLNRQTGQISLVEPMITLSSLTAGSAFTRAKLITTSLPNGTSMAGNLWMIIDGAAESVAHGFRTNTGLRWTQFDSAHIKIEGISSSGNTEGFENVEPGDWLLIWAETTDLSMLQENAGFWRVERVIPATGIGNTGPALVLNVGNSNTFHFNPLPALPLVAPTDRIVVVRSLAPMQKLSFGIMGLGSLSAYFQNNLSGVKTEVRGDKLRISTKTTGEDGELYLVAADTGGKALGVTPNTLSHNITSHLGFVVTADTEAGIPAFSHSMVTGAIDEVTLIDAEYQHLGGTLDSFIEMLNSYDIPSQAELPDTNKGVRILVEDFDSLTGNMTILPPSYIRDIRGATVDPWSSMTIYAMGQVASFGGQHYVSLVDANVANQPDTSPGSWQVYASIQANDRYFIRSSYQFDSRDQATIIIDGEPTTKTYSLPVARRLKVDAVHSAPAIQSFSAADIESSLDLKDASSFYDFDFKDFKAWRQAGAMITDGNYLVRVKSADFGPVGDKIRVGFIYPDALTRTTMGYTVLNSDICDIGLYIPVRTPRTRNWDGTAAFTTAVTTVNGRDVVTYQWRVGTQPDFSATGAQVGVGDVCILDPLCNFLDGNHAFRARVSSVAAQQFSIEIPTGNAVSDNVAFSSIINQNGLITVTSAIPHQIKANERIGIWNTPSPDGFVYPFNTTYYPNLTGPSSFTVVTPPSVPGGAVQAGTHAANVITITSANHGLSAGNVILITGVGSLNYEGLYPVSKVLNVNQFQYVVSGSSPSVTAGRWDYQPFTTLPVSTPITAISRVGFAVTVTAAGHGLTPTDIVNINGVTEVSYVPATTYAAGDVVRYGGTNYVSLAGANVGNQPDISPTFWLITDQTFNGNWVVDSIAGADFVIVMPQSGAMSGTGVGGSASEVAAQGSLARCLGANGDLLAFGEIGITAQEAVDWITTNIPTVLTAANFGLSSAVVDRSTADLGIATDYLFGNVVSIQALIASALINITVDSFVPGGATVNITTGATPYNGSYTVLKSVASGPNYVLTCQSAIFSSTTGIVGSSSGIFTGHTDFQIMSDGENWIKSSTLDTLVGIPQFALKRAWATAPASGEEIRLVATTAEQICRFWNKLVVTGLSNMTTIENSQYGRQIQITTNLLGSTGSVQVAGGAANAGQIAVVGSAAEVEGKVGQFNIPYEARISLVAGNWITLDQTVTQNKILGFNGNTSLQVFSDGIQIVGGINGTFQTKRITTQDATSVYKVEKHGEFLAFIRVAGTSMGLASDSVQFVREGDWIRIRYVEIGNSWSAGTFYPLGGQIDYTDGYSYECLTANTASIFNAPDSTAGSTYWRRLGFNFSNQGIFKVVRVFGQDTFWIENVNAVEEMIKISDSAELEFYSHDSVMPGDKLQIAGIILGAQNVGQYEVIDESAGGQFPTASRIWTTLIPIPQTPISLGDSFTQVNVEEGLPIRLWKRILTVGPGQSGYASVIVDSPNLMNRISSSLGAYLTEKGKLGFNLAINYGVDSYKYYKGLIKQLNRVIYGDPSNPIDFPGVRAAGTDVDIKPAIVKRLTISVAVRIRTGVPFSEIRERVKSSIAGYVNTLGVGAQVSLSKVVEAAGRIDGVIAVVLTYPEYDAANDLIYVGADEKAFIADPANDVTCSILGS